ncbi:hypothetical protein LQK93_00990 [Terrabacter sp. BE26]
MRVSLLAASGTVAFGAGVAEAGFAAWSVRLPVESVPDSTEVEAAAVAATREATPGQ